MSASITSFSSHIRMSSVHSMIPRDYLCIYIADTLSYVPVVSIQTGCWIVKRHSRPFVSRHTFVTTMFIVVRIAQGLSISAYIVPSAHNPTAGYISAQIMSQQRGLQCPLGRKHVAYGLRPNAVTLREKKNRGTDDTERVRRW